METFELIQSYRRRINVMTRCKIPKFCERYKTDIEIYDPKSKRKQPRNVKQGDICVDIHNIHYCVLWKKTDEIVCLKGWKK